MKKIKQYSDFLNEATLGPIDLKKLQHYAYAIAILCNGEYGDVYFNDKEIACSYVLEMPILLTLVHW